MTITKMYGPLFLLGLTSLSMLLSGNEASSAFDYGAALTKTLLYYEAQRSGKLSSNQRIQWRGDSALQDGNDVGMDLTGGYYDAGDNMKFGFPMAYTITMLSWSTIEFQSSLQQRRELRNALDAIKWGTDYLIKAHPNAEVLYGQVGEGNADHSCWMRPEDMTTPRPAYKIDAQHPGSDLAAETAAALASASIAFAGSNKKYSSLLLEHAKQIFDFANKYQGVYQNSINDAGQFYSSSGFKDELLWAAAWLHGATGESKYLDYLSSAGDVGGTRTEFSWNDKYVGAQVLVAKLVLEGKVKDENIWHEYKTKAEEFICACLQKSNNNIRKTAGGLLWFLPWNNLQYVTAATLVSTVYAGYLNKNHTAVLKCPAGDAAPDDIINFVRSQADYVLGSNPKGISYMVGFGSHYPVQAHHRGASIVSIKKNPSPVTCKGGFDAWFNQNQPNPNVLEGAIVGGPNENDEYNDSRSNFQLNEPATVTPAPFVGVLARLASG